MQASEVWCSLITVTYNSSATLIEFWGSAGRPPAGVEWIVVDNASSDGSADVARSLGATVVIEQSSNVGFSASNNAGLAASRGRFVGFVNPDVLVDYDDLLTLSMIAADEQAIVSPQLLNADRTLQPNGRGYPLLFDKIRNRLGKAEKLTGRYLLFGETAPTNVCWLMGASIFGERDVIESFGAWDDHFFLYYEDKDFCLRAWKKGVPVMVIPKIQWTHGWARETTTANATPWKRELASLSKFYVRYPEFLFNRAIAARAHKVIDSAVFGVTV
ncbi:hypothetical protein ASC66_09470 [Leifsonia sp. Root4]|nr:hypothetical protein ASC66_09470 [Leifsonia sp. Root4]